MPDSQHARRPRADQLWFIALASVSAASAMAQTLKQPGGQQPTEEVVVTGTHIRGVAPVGVRLITITEEEIRAGGFTRVEEVLRSLPQNFNGGPREDTLVQQTGLDRTTSTNLSKGTTVNLRGLGGGTTLILVNGRRLSPSGTLGLFSDVSNLPLAAVARIEVLTDGASALYGSDAVGGVVNVVLRKDYRGAETSARFTSGSGGTHDRQFNQMLGTSWGSGTVNLSYEYTDRDVLMATSRPFSADSDQRTRGGDNFSSTSANPGTIYIGTRTWAIPANQNGSNLDPASMVEGTVNFLNGSENLALLPEQTRQSTTLFASQEVADAVSVWVQAFGTRRESEAPRPWSEQLTVPRTNAYYVNPMGGTGNIVVRYDMTRDFGGSYAGSMVETYNAATGIEVRANAAWRITAEIARGEERAENYNDGINRTALSMALADSNRATALNPFGDGAFTNPATIDALRQRNVSKQGSDLTTASLLAEGPVWTWRAGDVRLALGGDYRDYAYSSQGQSNSTSADRDIDAYFAELRVPLVGESNRMNGVRELTVSVAVRREQYSDFGASTVPKFGIAWTPLPGVRARATWSESFRAPDLSSLDESNNGFSLSPVPDSGATNGAATVLFWSGGNAALQPETADSLTAGADVDVPWVYGLRIGATYFRIDYTNRLRSPFLGVTNRADYLSNPNYASFVTREPDPEYRARVCSSGRASEENREACLTAPIAALIDARMANTAELNTDGLDVMIDYDRRTSFGDLALGLTATRIYSYKQAVVEGSPHTSLLNQKYSPVDTRLRAHASFDRQGATATAYINYVDDYRDVNGPAVRRIGSWTTFDIDLAYEFENERGPLAGLSFALNAQNAFDKDPPFVNTALGYDATNANPYGRVVSLVVRKDW